MWELDWPDEVLDELADIWVSADPATRDRMGGMIERLNTDLRRDPLDVGESRTGARRVVVRAGLTIYFRVDGDTVRVTHVRRGR